VGGGKQEGRGRKKTKEVREREGGDATKRERERRESRTTKRKISEGRGARGAMQQEKKETQE
jgi:hypothetical protein